MYKNDRLGHKVALLLLAAVCICGREAVPIGRENGLTLRARLVKVLQPARLSSGRLAEFPYAPFGTASYLPAGSARLFRHMLQGANTEDLAIGALLNLAFHGPPARSLALLEKAREQAPGDGRIASDLSAVYLDQGAHEDRAEALFLALCSAETACRLAPRLPEARFNLGLALERLFLVDAARKAFADYLAVDRTSGWANEARAHLVHLSRPRRAALWDARKAAIDSAAAAGDGAYLRVLLLGFLQQARRHLELDLLPRWGAGRSTEGAKEVLRTSRLIAKQVAALASDAMLEESIAAIDRAAQAPVRQAALASGHRAYAEASRLYDQYQLEAAAPAFARAEKALRLGGSPFRFWASLFVAACDYQRSHYKAALRRLDALEAEPATARYPALLGYTRWLHGLIDFITGRLFTARKSYEAALVDFQLAGEKGNQASVEYLLFETYDVFGEKEDAFRHLLRALSGTDDILETRRKQLIARSAAEAMLRSTEPRTSLFFENEAVRLAMSSANPVQIAEALRDQALSCHVAGDQGQALRNIAAARAYALRIADPGVTADVLVAEAEIQAREHPAAALAALSAALPLLVKTRYNETLTALYLLRGRLRIRSGARDLAASDFLAGIEQTEVTSTNLDDRSRLHYLERSSALFDEMVALLADSEPGAKATAFDYAERARGRALATLMGVGGKVSVRALRLGEVSRLLPAGLTLVEYAVLPDRVLAWVVADRAARAVVIPLRPGDLMTAVSLLRAGIAGRSAFVPASARLYRALITPLALPLGIRLVVVPDKSLYQVPFAALRDPTTGHYLIEDHTLEMAPSASVYLRCVSEARTRRAEHPTASVVLIVADPALDRSLAPSLSRLPGATAEALAIARIYGQGDLLTGSEATRTRFLRVIGEHKIVHFGGHAQIDSPSPLLARLLLAPEGADNGVLFARDIYGRRFRATELVVLSACNSAAGQVSESEGVSSLARPFLAGGVPGVIASQWEVDDITAASFSSKFYRLLASGEKAAAALRGALLELMRSRSPELSEPRAWAAFVLFGTGVAPEKGVTWLRK
jgi:hypothetical protein